MVVFIAQFSVSMVSGWFLSLSRYSRVYLDMFALCDVVEQERRVAISFFASSSKGGTRTSVL